MNDFWFKQTNVHLKPNKEEENNEREEKKAFQR